jgi:hypothetical protein
MAFLDPSERKTVKETLSQIFNKEDLQKQLDVVQEKKHAGPHDAKSEKVIDQFAALLEEIIAEKKQPPTHPDFDINPEMTYFKRKYDNKK